MSYPQDTQDPRHRRPSREGDDLHPSARTDRDSGRDAGPDADPAFDAKSYDAESLDDETYDEEGINELPLPGGHEADDDGDDDGNDVIDAIGDPLDVMLAEDMHIEFAEDDDFFVDSELDEVSAARSRLTVEELLRRLREDVASLDLRDLFVLSDLSRSEMAQVERELPLAPVDVRRRMLRELTMSSEEIVELDLGRFLRVALRDEDAIVRRLAIEGLWDETEADLIGPLTSILANDADQGVRAAAAAALGAYVLAGELDEMDTSLTMRAEQALLAALQTPSEPIRVQARALESLAYSSEAGMRQLIEDAYYAPDEEMRVASLRAMGRSADTRWRTMVRQELSSPDAAMRAEAARACGELEMKAATQEIVGLTEDAEQEVRLAAIEALGHLGGKEAREVLRTLAGEGEEAEASAAEIALEEMLFYDDVAAVPLLDDDDDDEEGYDDDPDGDERPWSRPPSGKGGNRP
jgi:HEAT repeat protein